MSNSKISNIGFEHIMEKFKQKIRSSIKVTKNFKYEKKIAINIIGENKNDLLKS